MLNVLIRKQLRVNQAGELAAVLIYDAQTPPIVRQNPQLKDLMKHMYDQEAGHFSKLRLQRAVRTGQDGQHFLGLILMHAYFTDL